MKMSSAGQTMGATCSSRPKSLAEGVSGIWIFLCHIYMYNIVDFQDRLKIKLKSVQYSFLTGPLCGGIVVFACCLWMSGARKWTILHII